MHGKGYIMGHYCIQFVPWPARPGFADLHAVFGKETTSPWEDDGEPCINFGWWGQKVLWLHARNRYIYTKPGSTYCNHAYIKIYISLTQVTCSLRPSQKEDGRELWTLCCPHHRTQDGAQGWEACQRAADRASWLYVYYIYSAAWMFSLLISHYTISFPAQN